MIALKNVTKSWGKNTVLSNVSVRIDPGASLCIAGESGSGKSILLRMLIRTDDPDSGSVEVDGVNIRTLPAPLLQLYRRRVGVIFQEPILVEHLTIEENLGLPLDLLGAPQALITRNTHDLLKRLNLLSKATLFPAELTTSERCLVCIARAIITAPMVVVADEPFHNLDTAQTKMIVELLLNMRKKGTTIVLLSRDGTAGKLIGADTLHLKDGKISKQAEAETSVQKMPADTHRILEEDDTELSAEFSLDEDTDAIAVKTKPAQSGKRIRITSIGSNS